MAASRRHQLEQALVLDSAVQVDHEEGTGRGDQEGTHKEGKVPDVGGSLVLEEDTIQEEEDPHKASEGNHVVEVGPLYPSCQVVGDRKVGIGDVVDRREGLVARPVVKRHLGRESDDQRARSVVEDDEHQPINECD